MQMILIPAVITLAITLLRLTGELQHWSPKLFNPTAGGGAALVGISWLPLILGPYFAWKVAQSGKGPKNAWSVAGMALLGLVITIGSFGAAQRIGVAAILAAFLISLAAAFFPWKAWPELARVLFAYALAARIPVALVMLAAIYGNWGTHYDVLPPNPTPELVAMGPLGRWFFIGFIPQMTGWIAFTVLAGSLIGAVVVALGKPKRA